MHLRVDLGTESPTAELQEREDCTRLHVEVHGVGTTGAATQAALDRALQATGFGSLDDDPDAGAGPKATEVLVGLEPLRAAAGRGRPSGWERDFDAMVDHARSKGWLSGERVRAHVVWHLATPAVTELRLVVTASDYDQAVRFYRDHLGLPQREAYTAPEGRVTILEAGQATLEIADPAQTEFIDRVEVGRRVAGHIRVAFEVDDAAAATRRLHAAGATVVAEPTVTPWRSLNARLEGPAGLQLTLFETLPPPEPDAGA